MSAVNIHERKIAKVRSEVEGTDKSLAMTECHFTLDGRDRGDLMASWAVGVAYARMLNLHERHGDLLQIATLSDFCGTRWQVNSVIIPTPHGRSYLLPVGHVMGLYRKHSGEHALQVQRMPSELDVTASRSGNRIFLHVVNTSRDHAVNATFDFGGQNIQSGQVWEIAADPETEILQSCPDAVEVVQKSLVLDDQGCWGFPAASVSVVEIEL